MATDSQDKQKKTHIKVQVTREQFDKVDSFVSEYEETMGSKNTFGSRAFAFYIKMFLECDKAIDEYGFPKGATGPRAATAAGEEKEPTVRLVPTQSSKIKKDRASK